MTRFLCWLTGGCKFKAGETECHCNDKTKMVTITETCYKCGKKYSFTSDYAHFNIPE